MKKRLDQILLDENLFDNRSKARAYIVDGKVIVDGEKITKAGSMFDFEKIKIEIIKKENNFVSRAGDKLLKAINLWSLDLSDKVCLDIGSSTGGFTDCCLQHGAKNVFAVDVGTNQLDWKLRSDKKVISMEKVNFRNCIKEDFNLPIDFFCCDVSFISVTKMIEPLEKIVEENVEGVILIKPQFESERHEVKNGVVNDLKLHFKCIKKVINFCLDKKFSSINLFFSPILGNKKKNIEYLLLIKKNNSPKNIDDDKINLIVKEAWDFFDGK